MNADRISSFYRWMEYLAFGRSLEKSRFSFLHVTKDAVRVLILGEGDGRFLKNLLLSNRKATVDVLDSSAGMLALARACVPAEDCGRVQFHCADALKWELRGRSYDLIVTQFFLDCLSPIDATQLISRLDAALSDDGFWIVSEFRQPPRALARIHAWLWLRTMYLFFRFATGLKVSSLPPYEALLASANLELIDRRDTRFGLITAQLWRKRLTAPAESASSSRER